jgi:hypothetical protein
VLHGIDTAVQTATSPRFVDKLRPKTAHFTRLHCLVRGLLVVDVAAWLALFSGVVFVGAMIGADAVPELVAYALMLTAFVFLPPSLVSALAADA